MPVVFDLDGTLIDSAPQIQAVVNATLATEGIDALPLEQVKSFIGNGLPHALHLARQAAGVTEDPPRNARMLARAEALYLQDHGLSRLYPGVMTALDRLAALGPLGLCTNKPLAATRAVLAHFGLARHFDTVIGGDSLPQRKPDPAPLLAAFAGLGPGPQVFVGDSEVDAATAGAAGVPFLLYAGGYLKSPVETVHCAAIFADFAQLPELVSATLATA